MWAACIAAKGKNGGIGGMEKFEVDFSKFDAGAGDNRGRSLLDEGVSKSSKYTGSILAVKNSSAVDLPSHGVFLTFRSDTSLSLDSSSSFCSSFPFRRSFCDGIVTAGNWNGKPKNLGKLVESSKEGGGGQHCCKRNCVGSNGGRIGKFSMK